MPILVRTIESRLSHLEVAVAGLQANDTSTNATVTALTASVAEIRAALADPPAILPAVA